MWRGASSSPIPAFRSGLVLQAIAAFWSCRDLYRALQTHTPDELRLKRHFALVFLRWMVVIMVSYLGIGLIFGRYAAFVFVAIYAAATIMTDVAPDQFLRAMPGGAEDAQSARGPRQSIVARQSDEAAFCTVLTGSAGAWDDRCRVGAASARDVARRRAFARRQPERLSSDYYGAFPARMRELGYMEGRNLVIVWCFAAGDYDRLPRLAAELVAAKVNVILALGPPGAVAARKANSEIPIVFVMSSDPVAAGLVKSLAKPEGNVTDIFNLAGDLGSKHLEMLTAVVPKVARVGVLLNPGNPGHSAAFNDIEVAARRLAKQAIPVHAQTPEQIEVAFGAMTSARVGAAMVALDPLFIQETTVIAQQALGQRLPSIFANREYAEAGGLMSYGQNQAEIYSRAAEYIDRILKGAKPGELPVEQPTKLELCINNRTARMLGLTMPQSLRLLASTVIE